MKFDCPESVDNLLFWPFLYVYRSTFTIHSSLRYQQVRRFPAEFSPESRECLYVYVRIMDFSLSLALLQSVFLTANECWG